MSCDIGNKDIDYLLLHVLGTRCYLKLRLRTNFKSILKTAQQSHLLSNLKEKKNTYNITEMFYIHVQFDIIIRHINYFTRNLPDNVQNLSVLNNVIK